MITINHILKNRYYDSVVLMNAAGQLKSIPSVKEASLMMGTDANKDLMRATNLLTSEGETAGAGDLIMALVIDCHETELTSCVTLAQQQMEEALAPKAATGDEDYFPRSFDGVVKMLPGVNLAVISIPGEHVDYTAHELLDRDIHLMLFSDNVPLEVEVALKKKGEEKGLLVMGPDCGTVLIGGAALGFANKVRQGNIGLVAAAGTGIQEVSTLIHKMGGGVSHAIGTGGRDLSKEVGGITMKMGIKTLLEDPATDVLVLISKPPHPDVEKEIYALLHGVKKTVVINFLGSAKTESDQSNIIMAPTLEEAAIAAVKAIGREGRMEAPENQDALVEEQVNNLAPSQKYMRGLYSGGTLGNETRLILEKSGVKLYSNLTKDPDWKMKDPFKSKDNTLVDMGDDVFTKGAPHPMIDSTKRIARILQEARDPETAIILLDLVLGYGAHPDPAPELAETLIKAQEIARNDGRYLIYVGSVCGVPEDPQDATKQKKDMERAGVIMFPSNAAATRFTVQLMKAMERTAAV